jgi:pimeloyl-ACP methyl ester carboxylesterase
VFRALRSIPAVRRGLWGATASDDFARLIKSSTVEIINEPGHLPQLEQTEATQEKVLAQLG